MSHRRKGIKRLKIGRSTYYLISAKRLKRMRKKRIRKRRR